MALYLGEDKVKLNLDGIMYFLNLCSGMPVFDGGILLSSDGSILKDLNDYYLTIEEVG